MKRLVFLFILLVTLILIMLSGCSKTLENFGKEVMTNKSENLLKNYQILVIDSCQYIMGSSYNEGYLAHKGNCNNPIHKK